MTERKFQITPDGIIHGKIDPAWMNHMIETTPALQNKQTVYATYYGYDYPINGGPGIWVLDNVTDEIYDRLSKLPPGRDQETINRNLETVGAVYYEHWNMDRHTREAIEESEKNKDKEEVVMLEKRRRRGVEKL